VGLWSSIRSVWTRHDDRLAENELERESVGVEQPSIIEPSAFVQESANEAEKGDQAAE